MALDLTNKRDEPIFDFLFFCLFFLFSATGQAYPRVQAPAVELHARHRHVQSHQSRSGRHLRPEDRHGGRQGESRFQPSFT